MVFFIPLKKLILIILILNELNLLKYINLYNAKIDNIKDQIQNNIKGSTIVCQKLKQK